MPRSTFLYRPSHPLANDNGFITREQLYSYSDDTPRVTGYISDQMEATRNMADGKMYTSKAAFRKATKRAGCIEVGDQLHYMHKPKEFTMPDRRQRREDISRAIYEVRNGRDIRNT